MTNTSSAEVDVTTFLITEEYEKASEKLTSSERDAIQTLLAADPDSGREYPEVPGIRALDWRDGLKVIYGTGPDDGTIYLLSIADREAESEELTIRSGSASSIAKLTKRVGLWNVTSRLLSLLGIH